MCMSMMPRRKTILEVSIRRVRFTYANFDNMLRSILLVTIDNFSIRQQITGDIMTPSNDLVLPGNYEIISEGKIFLV